MAKNNSPAVLISHEGFSHKPAGSNVDVSYKLRLVPARRSRVSTVAVLAVGQLAGGFSRGQSVGGRGRLRLQLCRGWGKRSLYP
jgi:hypothetical protein